MAIATWSPWTCWRGIRSRRIWKTAWPDRRSEFPAPACKRRSSIRRATPPAWMWRSIFQRTVSSSRRPMENFMPIRSALGVPGASMQAPFFYSSSNTARVDVAIDIPADSIKFEKAHGKFHAELNILAIAYRPDGSVAARFSDNKKIEVENKKEVQAFTERPYYYDGQFDIASGQYTLKTAFSSGGPSFGKVEMPLTIDPYDSKQFGLSALALSKDLHRTADVGTDLDAVLLEGRTPLVAQGYQ